MRPRSLQMTPHLKVRGRQRVVEWRPRRLCAAILLETCEAPVTPRTSERCMSEHRACEGTLKFPAEVQWRTSVNRT